MTLSKFSVIMWMMIPFITVMLALVSMTSSMPVPMPTTSNENMTMDDVVAYLRRNNFLGENNPDEELKQMEAENLTAAIHEGIRHFQRMYYRFNLTETGEADSDTITLMLMPRCGLPDMMPESMMKRRKRYLLQGGTWPRYQLTYKVTEYPADGDLTPSQVDDDMLRALRVWEEVSPLRFTRLDASDQTIPDIEIKFVPTLIDHGDGFPFDGPSGTLAHAFFPGQGQISGDSHFDEAETWTQNSFQGINLFQVAAHEIGHALGLGHSEDPNALMAPFYQGYIPNFQLPLDDTLGIQAKYGRPVVQPPPTTAPTTTTTRSTTTTTAAPDVSPTVTQVPPGRTTGSGTTFDICADGIFDAITTVSVGEDQYQTYAFRGENCYLLQNGAIADGYPRIISSVWPGLPSSIDAAVFWDAEYEYSMTWNEVTEEWESTRRQVLAPVTFFFKGNRYWSIEDMTVTNGAPIANWGFPNNVQKIDAAFKWMRNGRTYFFTGDEYYGYTENVGMGANYPRSTSVWGDIPSQPDAVFYWTETQEHIFFSGDKFYPYNDDEVRVKDGYPRDTKTSWLNCDNLATTQITSAATTYYLSAMVALLFTIFVHLFIN